MAFELVNQFSGHLAVHASDLRLNPPPSYLFVQDALIIACGLLYLLFSMVYIHEVRHCQPHIPSWVSFFCGGNLAWELFYGLSVPKTLFEHVSFMSWFLLDLAFTSTIVMYGTFEGRKRDRGRDIAVLALIWLLLLYGLTILFPDDGQQMTAYWTGILLQVPWGWFDIEVLYRTRQTGLMKPEIWITRVLGTLLAYGVFVWRYLNVPENWGYVASGWSMAIFVATIAPEVCLPFLYCWIRLQGGDYSGARSKTQGKRRRD